MAAVGGLTPNKGHSRRCSSIPRPTSKLTPVRTTPPPAAGTTVDGGKAAVTDTPQTMVKPRTYSRTRRTSFFSNQNDPPSSFKTFRAQPPRLSLPVTTSQHMGGSSDLSGTRQQLPLSHYSRQSLASLDAIISSVTAREENNTNTSLPLPSHRTKSNTSSSFAKVTSPAIAQRQLMGPLGPPMPRSQTMRNLTCFGGAVGNTPSPSKSTSRTISTVSHRSKVDVMDALAESRMTETEIEFFNQVAKEVEANRQRLKGPNRATRVTSNNAGMGLASSTTLTSFTRSNGSSEHRPDVYDDMMIGDSSRKLPFKGAKLKIISRWSPSISPLVLTPDSGVSMGSKSDEGWEINVKLVYFLEPVQYWRGRFSTLSDRLRSEDYSIDSCNFAETATSTWIKRPLTPNIDKGDSFEIDEVRRSLLALKELRSCCRTADALRSFDVFAQEIDAKYEQESAATQQSQFCTHSAETKARLIATGFRPKVLGLDKNIAAATMKVINTELKLKPSMTRSKTMGDVAQITKAVTDGKSEKDAKVGWRRPSYLKAQEEVLASEVALGAERRARAVAAAQRNARRSGIGVGAATGTRILAQDRVVLSGMKPPARHSLPRKSSGTSAGMGTNAEMLKRVFSDSVRSVRRMGRSFTGMSGSGDV